MPIEGKSSRAEHAIWAGVKSRCYCLSAGNYRYYGARGVTMCEEWRNSFEAFYRDMGPRPPNHSLDRRDPNGDYTPDNCRWATPLEQANNRRRHRVLTVNGKSHTVAEWARITGIDENVLFARLRQRWSPVRTLTEPVGSSQGRGPRPQRQRVLTCRGETRRLREWSDLTGIPAKTLHTRINKGWSVERILSQPMRNYHVVTLNGRTQPLKDWARERGLRYKLVHGRLRVGWSIERALGLAEHHANPN